MKIKFEKYSTLPTFLQKDFTKNYGAGEEATRFEHFKKNLKFIEEHNAKFERGESGFSVAINELSDRTPEERKRIRGRVPSPSTQGN